MGSLEFVTFHLTFKPARTCTPSFGGTQCSLVLGTEREAVDLLFRVMVTAK